MLSKHGAAAKRTITFLVVGLVFAIFAPSALAGPGNTCGGESHNGKQLYEHWKSEGVLQEAVNATLKPAGYRAVDNTSVKKWMEEHVFLIKLAKTTTIKDYGCESGHLIGAGPRTYYKGEMVLGVFSTVSKNEVRTTPHKGYKRKSMSTQIVGAEHCSNPNGGHTQGVGYVKARKHHPKPHHHKKHHKKKPPAKGPICSQNSGNGTSCGGGPCSNTTIIVGSGNTVNSSTECKTEEPKKSCGCTPVPPEEPCGCVKPEPTIMITGKTELNMIPVGKTSGDFYINVNASESGGTLTVDPGIGGVSSCSSTTPEDSVTINVPSGASKECVILYAPEDADNPSSMTVTMTACLVSVCDTKTETVPLTNPTRP